MYDSLSEFLDDLEQVFINCRIYNGTESIVGRIGTQVQNECENLIRDLKLRERFGSDQERKKFMLNDVNLHQSQARKTSHVKADARNHESGNENSDDDIPRHQVPYHKNGTEDQNSEPRHFSRPVENRESVDISEKGSLEIGREFSHQFNEQSQHGEEIFEEE